MKQVDLCDADAADIGRAFMAKLPERFSWGECPTEFLNSQIDDVAELRDALRRLLTSDPTGSIPNASDEELRFAATDENADPIVREQAAAVLQARDILGSNVEVSEQPKAVRSTAGLGDATEGNP